MKRAWLLPAILCLFFSVVSANAQVEKITSVEGITEYRFESNGLRILLFPDLSKPTITVNVIYLVGSRHEDYGETGMAHLLEHLLFKGSKNHPNVPKELQDHGSRPNGTTWFDRTNYFETFQASDANLEWALDLEADRMVNSFVAKKDLDSEMTVVRNEFERGENSPMEVLEERVMSTAFLWHNYGKSTIGARSDIENVPIERLQAFYRNYYQPDNAILLVAGKFDEARTLGLITKYFGPIPKPQRVLQPNYTVEPTQDGERSVTLRRVGEVQGVVVAYHLPPGSHPDFAALDVAAEILGDSPSGRLYKALVETKKATNVAGYSYQLKEPGVALFSTSVRKESSLEDARATLLRTIDDVASKPFTSEEVERERASIPKGTRGSVVFANLRLEFGDEKSLMGYSTIGRLTSAMLMRGTTKHTRQELQDELDRLKARMNVFGGATGVTVTIETVKENLPKVLEVAAEVLRQPLFPASEFESLRQQQIAGVESQKTEPGDIASQAYSRHMNPYPKGDIRYVPTFDEQIEELRSVTLDQLKKFHTEFYGASNGEAAIVGDVDSEDAQKTVSTEIGAWKSPRPYEQVKNQYRKVESLN